MRFNEMTTTTTTKQSEQTYTKLVETQWLLNRRETQVLELKATTRVLLEQYTAENAAEEKAAEAATAAKEAATAAKEAKKADLLKQLAELEELAGNLWNLRNLLGTCKAFVRNLQYLAK